MPSDRPPTSTTCVHAGEAPDRATGALEPPLHLANAFAFDDADQAAAAFRGEDPHFIYGRWGNPTTSALEAKMAALEGGEAAAVMASGMAAISALVTSVCSAGDHVVAPQSMYGEASRLLRERLPRFGIDTTFVDARDPDAYARAITSKTKLLYVETPANPTLSLVDLRAVAALGRARGLTVLADNTFATPYCQRPLALGADVVVHSMTKSIGGHGDAIGGALVGDRKRVDAARELAVKGFGGVLSPFTSMLLSRGIRTFALRMKQACANAMAIAQALEAHAAVARVHYPGLASHPQHALARSQMSDFGALVAFELAGGIDAGKRFLSRVRVVTHAVSLGDVRSLVTHPASTTHSTMPKHLREQAFIADGLLRLSCGIEETDDLVADVRQALDQK